MSWQKDFSFFVIILLGIASMINYIFDRDIFVSIYFILYAILMTSLLILNERGTGR